jgi:Xaa-Pro aminopeptidase
MFEGKQTYVNVEAADQPLENPIAHSTVETVRLQRLAKMRRKVIEHNCAGILLFDPLNIRYATDTSNMQVWTMHNPARYCMVMADGPVILWDYHNCEHLSENHATVDEIRPAISCFYFSAGTRLQERTKRWGAEILDVVKQHGGGNARLAVDKCEPEGLFLLKDLGLDIIEGQELTETARKIKSPEEIELMDWTIKVCEQGMWRMRAHSRDGKTENEVWAELHYENIRNGGEWIETRLLSAGERTNPWFAESSAHVMHTGDMLAFDTDMIGPYGYCSDISRSWTVEHTPPTPEQSEIYHVAMDHIHHNEALLKPGMSFAEFNKASFQIPERYQKNRYGSALHGVGLCDEFPAIPTHVDFAKASEGVFEPGEVVCVESYTGTECGREGVKLEIQVLITEDGHRRLDTFPFEDWGWAGAA